MSDPAILSFDDRVARLTINRPDARNALSVEIIDALHERLGELESDARGAHVLVLTGAGKAFCAGMDLKAVLIEHSGDPDLGRRLLTSLAELTLRLRALPMVTIASVNGAAIGGGCGLTCVCDLSVTHADAKLGFPEVDLGLCPAVIAPWVMRKLGPGVARRALLMGGVMSGEQARSIGLADFLAPDRAGLEALTREVAERLASGGPKALAATKALLNRLDGSEDRDTVLRGAELSAAVLATPEAQAALRARTTPKSA
jgi:enoyl-CoA hydratase/carnithine racemase